MIEQHLERYLEYKEHQQMRKERLARQKMRYQILALASVFVSSWVLLLIMAVIEVVS